MMILVVLAVFVTLPFRLGSAVPGLPEPLRFKKDGTFQLSIFEDLHFGENAWDDWGPQQDINSMKVLNSVLDYDPPDLVVLNGDLITGENTFLENSTAYVDQMVRPMVERGLPWASCYGNHDSDFNISGDAILAREQQWPNCRTRRMVSGKLAGVTNYYLPVYGHECRHCDCAPELILWFFDSRGGWYFQENNSVGDRVGRPDWVDESVVEWFRESNARITKKFNKTIPSLGFTHIPVTAALELQRGVGVYPNLQPGINDDIPLARQGGGWCEDDSNHEGCVYGGQDIPFMKAITSTPGFMALFSGHDHGDTWCYKWDRLLPGMTVEGNGINLCFGQHSGYGGYGNWIRGARQVQISQEKLRQGLWEVDTWIRLEDGDVVGSVSLNSTYGQDIYPVTPNKQRHCPTCNYTVGITEPRSPAQRRLEGGPANDR